MELFISGPIFDGRADLEVVRYLTEAEMEVAEYAKDQLYNEFDAHFQHPTGYYKSQVQVRKGINRVAVNDGGVVYGPWLEGVGSRNYPRTRFKGYSSFRRVANRLKTEATVVASVVIKPYIWRMR